jgi:hypothetical protein
MHKSQVTTAVVFLKEKHALTPTRKKWSTQVAAEWCQLRPATSIVSPVSLDHLEYTLTQGRVAY